MNSIFFNRSGFISKIPNKGIRINTCICKIYLKGKTSFNWICNKICRSGWYFKCKFKNPKIAIRAIVCITNNTFCCREIIMIPTAGANCLIYNTGFVKPTCSTINVFLTNWTAKICRIY